MTLEPFAWIAAGGAYLAVTAILATDRDGDSAEALHPRNWIWLPLTGFVMAAGPLGGMLVLMLIAQHLGVFPERWIIPGLFVFWTVLMIYMRADAGMGGGPRKRQGVLSLKGARAAALRPAQTPAAAPPADTHAGTRDGVALAALLAPEPASTDEGRGDGGRWDDGSRVPSSAACEEERDTAPSACADPEPASPSWDGGDSWDDGSSSGGSSDD